LVTDLVIWQKLVDLTVYAIPILNKMPKNQRFVLAQQIQNKMLDMVTGVIEANKARDKAALIDKLDTELDKLRFLVRVSHQLALIKSEQYEQLAKRMIEIGKMIGGWQRKFK
jgi:four helix bundle protein